MRVNIWGNNHIVPEFHSGQNDYNFYPTRILEGVTDVSVGNGHILILKEDSSLWGRGWNNNGQLGDGTNRMRSSAVHIMDNVSSMSAGGAHSVAVQENGSLWTWGLNHSGALGNGSTVNSYEPINVLNDVASAFAGSGRTFAIKRDGSLYGWGGGSFTPSESTIYNNSIHPTRLVENVVTVSPRSQGARIIRNNGDLWGWGEIGLGWVEDLRGDLWLSPISSSVPQQIVTTFFRTGFDVSDYIEHTIQNGFFLYESDDISVITTPYGDWFQVSGTRATWDINFLRGLLIS